MSAGRFWRSPALAVCLLLVGQGAGTAQTPKPAGAPAGSQQKGSSSSGEEAPRETSSFFGSGVQGALIVGVASSSSRESVRVWNNYTHYDDWEFLGIGGNVGMVQPGQASQPAPGQQGIPGRQGMQPPMLPPLTDQPMTPR